MAVSFPGESAAYRNARNALLQAEVELRAQTERVASLRRQLPLGGRVKEDYAFDELVDDATRTTRLSALFAGGKDTLFLYGFMYGPRAKQPCPLCTSFLDGLEGQVDHLSAQINVAVVARSPIERIHEFAQSRGWNKLRLLSSANCTYQADYLAEDAEGNQWPMANVFVQKGGAIHHFWGSEMLYEGRSASMDSRHIDMLWPLWNVLDLTPGGRGADFYPKLVY